MQTKFQNGINAHLKVTDQLLIAFLRHLRKSGETA